MTYQLRAAGEFEIVATASDSAAGGFVAGVEVRSAALPTVSPQVVFADANLSNGFCFATSTDALTHALDVGHRVVRQRSASKAA